MLLNVSSGVAKAIFMMTHTKFIRSFILFLLFPLLMFLSAVSVFAQTKDAELALTVGSGEWKTVRLKSLPAGAEIQIEVACSVPVTILLIDQSGYSFFPDSPTAPLFRSHVIEALFFTVKIPHNGHYYLLIDNRTGVEESATQLHIKASNGPIPDSDLSPVKPGVRGPEKKQTDFSKKLELFVKQLQQVFLFDTFQIVTRDCRNTTPAENRTKIPLCVDRVQQLFAKTGDREKATDLLVFALFHEVGHLLLEQWEYPFFNNGEIADEFAGVMLGVLQQERRLDTVAEYFSTGPAASEMMDSLFIDNRHKNFIRQPEVILNYKYNLQKRHRWLNFLLQHLQTSMLNKLLNSPYSGFSPESVRKEMLRRGLKI